MADDIKTVDLTELTDMPTKRQIGQGALAVLRARQAERQASKTTPKSSSSHTQLSGLPSYGSYGRDNTLPSSSAGKKRKHAYEIESQSSRKSGKKSKSESKKESVYAFPGKESTQRFETKTSSPKFKLPTFKDKIDEIMSSHAPTASNTDYSQRKLLFSKDTMTKANVAHSGDQQPPVQKIMSNVKAAGINSAISSPKRSSTINEDYEPPALKPAKSRYASAACLAFASSDSGVDEEPSTAKCGTVFDEASKLLTDDEATSQQQDSLFLPLSPAELNASNSESTFTSTQPRFDKFWDSTPEPLGFASRKVAFEKQARREPCVREFFDQNPHIRRPFKVTDQERHTPSTRTTCKQQTTHDALPLLPPALTTPPTTPSRLVSSLAELPAILGENQERWFSIMRTLKTENPALQVDNTALNARVEELETKVQAIEREQSGLSEHMGDTFRNFAQQTERRFRSLEGKLEGNVGSGGGVKEYRPI